MTRRSGLAHRCRPGMSMVEVAIASLVLGLMMSAALNAAALAAKIRGNQTAKSRALQMCTDLLSEMSAVPFPADTKTIPSAMTPGPRNSFDDLFDFAKWKSQPPVDPSGASLQGADNWERGVLMWWANPDHPMTISPTATGLVWIRVQVRRNGILLAEATMLRSIGSDRARWGD